MELMTERNQIRTVANRWHNQYGLGTNERRQMVFRQLSALDAETATAKDVAEIVGNALWVKPQECNECGAETWDAVQLGEEPNYESQTATICAGCLRQALNMLMPRETLAELAVADEREACARVCESMGALDAMDGEDKGSAAMVRVADRQAELCAAAIRARSNAELTNPRGGSQERPISDGIQSAADRRPGFSDGLGAWVRSADRLPMPQESPDGYFWGWNEQTPSYLPTLLEAWESDGLPMGFCHEACGVVNDISHWMPATPPKAPNAMLPPEKDNA